MRTQTDSNNQRKIYVGLRKRFLNVIITCLWVFLGLCCSQGFAGADPNREKAYDLELQVMSFNIRYGTADDGENNWKNRREMVFDLLRKNKSDVVGLQEALKFQIGEIIKAVPVFGVVGVGRDDGKTKGECPASTLWRE